MIKATDLSPLLMTINTTITSKPGSLSISDHTKNAQLALKESYSPYFFEIHRTALPLTQIKSYISFTVPVRNNYDIQ
jgi:hypothetical protein